MRDTTEAAPRRDGEVPGTGRELPGTVLEGYGREWSWSRDPARWSQTSGSPGELHVTAPGRTDLYSMPGHYQIDRLPLLQRTVTGDFTAWTRVTVQGDSFGDAAGLAVHGEDGWAKLCVERTRAGHWAVVTVLSRPDSDEAMGPSLPDPGAELMVTRQGRRFAVLFRQDRREPWQFVRTWFGAAAPDVRLGVFVQAPFSDAAEGWFEPMRLSPTPWRDQR